jgi:CHASE3 domain sensor protein
MGFFYNLKLRTKILALVGFLVLAMLGVGVFSLTKTTQLTRNTDEVIKVSEEMQSLLKAKAAFQNASTAV